MLRRLCDFCEKKEPDYTIKCRKTNHRIMFNHDWESVDICEKCYNKLFSKDKSEIKIDSSKLQKEIEKWNLEIMGD